jgi:hypothetical protein
MKEKIYYRNFEFFFKLIFFYLFVFFFKDFNATPKSVLVASDVVSSKVG